MAKSQLRSNREPKKPKKKVKPKSAPASQAAGTTVTDMFKKK